LWRFLGGDESLSPPKIWRNNSIAPGGDILLARVIDVHGDGAKGGVLLAHVVDVGGDGASGRVLGDGTSGRVLLAGVVA